MVVNLRRGAPVSAGTTLPSAGGLLRDPSCSQLDPSRTLPMESCCPGVKSCVQSVGAAPKKKKKKKKLLAPKYTLKLTVAKNLNFSLVFRFVFGLSNLIVKILNIIALVFMAFIRLWGAHPKNSRYTKIGILANLAFSFQISKLATDFFSF